MKFLVLLALALAIFAVTLEVEARRGGRYKGGKKGGKYGGGYR